MWARISAVAILRSEASVIGSFGTDLERRRSNHPLGDRGPCCAVLLWTFFGRVPVTLPLEGIRGQRNTASRFVAVDAIPVGFNTCQPQASQCVENENAVRLRVRRMGKRRKRDAIGYAPTRKILFCKRSEHLAGPDLQKHRR